MKATWDARDAGRVRRHVQPWGQPTATRVGAPFHPLHSNPTTGGAKVLSPDEDTRSGLALVASVIVGLLIDGEYDTVLNMASESLSATDLAFPVEFLGQPLVDLPRWQLGELAITPDAEGFTLVVPLWTADGPAGLGAELHVVPTTYGTFQGKIQGFRPVEVVSQPTGDLPGWLEPMSAVREPVPPADDDDPVPDRWRPILGAIVHRLVAGDYTGLAADGLLSFTTDPTDDSIGRWIEDYPANLVELPDEAWAYSHHFPEPGQPGAWAVVIDLWTAEEGHSDLSLEATVWDDGTDIVVKVHNIHML